MVTALVWEKSTDYQAGVIDQDGLWKKVIGELFEDFMLFFSPELHEEVDFSVEAEFLQQEIFQQIIKEKTGRRSTDQLVKVRLKGGEEKWILIHVEVQSTNEKDFAKRMFQYFYRIYDRYDKEIVTLAIMTSPYNSESPTEFHYNYFGTELHYAYNNHKLIDYTNTTLEQSDKLFSKIVLAAKYKNDTEHNAEKRYTFKEKLMREMIKNDRYSDLEVQAVIYFIDYLLRLPEDLVEQLYNSLTPIIQEEGKTLIHTEWSPTNSGGWSPTMDAIFARVQENAEKVGMEKGLEQVVIEMLKKGFTLDLIAEVTHLERAKIERLRRRFDFE